LRVIVDNSVWSLALRRQRKELSHGQRALVLLLREMIIEGDAILLGVVRQEVLSGIPSPEVFEVLRQRLQGLEDLPPDTDDYERAAHSANECLRRGVATTIPDMLICAVASGRDLPVLSTDADFKQYARHLPIRLYPLQ
jgi:predicted nucleic acid-binding protein